MSKISRGSQNLGTVPKLYIVINYDGFTKEALKLLASQSHNIHIHSNPFISETKIKSYQTFGGVDDLVNYINYLKLT